MKIACVKNDVGDIGRHKIGSDDTASRKYGFGQFERVELGAVQVAVGKADIEQHFVDHCEIDI